MVDTLRTVALGADSDQKEAVVTGDFQWDQVPGGKRVI